MAGTAGHNVSPIMNKNNNIQTGHDGTRIIRPNENRQKQKQARGKTLPGKKKEGEETQKNKTHICEGPTGCIRSMYRLNDAGSRLHDHAKRDRRKKRENVITYQSCRQR